MTKVLERLHYYSRSSSDLKKLLTSTMTLHYSKSSSPGGFAISGAKERIMPNKCGIEPPILIEHAVND